MDLRLPFVQHMDHIMKRAIKMFGFIIKSTSEFKNIECIICTYYLVHSEINYYVIMSMYENCSFFVRCYVDTSCLLGSNKTLFII